MPFFALSNFVLTTGKIELLTLFLMIFLFSFTAVLLLTPVVQGLAQRYGIMDYPNERKVHKEPIPRMGGVGIYLGFLFGLVLGLLLLYHWLQSAYQIKGMKYLWVVLVATLGFFGLGILDDIYKLSAKKKFLVQIIIALFVIACGIKISFLHLPFFGVVYFHPWVGVVITLLWIAGVTNALNLTDGLDGLLSGIVAISGFTFFIAGFLKGQYLICLLMAPVIGAAMGFLPFNFHPAKIFMGDCGSLFLGGLFAVSSVVGAVKSTATIILLVPILILAYPILDTAIAIFRRIRKGVSPFHPDRGHLHHRLLTFGWSQSKAVLVLYLINLIFGAVAFLGLLWVK